MSECFSFVTAPWGELYQRVVLKLGALSLFYPAFAIKTSSGDNGDDDDYSSVGGAEGDEKAFLPRASKKQERLYVRKPRRSHEMTMEEGTVCGGATRVVTLDEYLASQAMRRWYVSNGGSSRISLFTKQGRKGVNQDTMLAWEAFGAQDGSIFCGVFDGHGRHGHLVARTVRDTLPKLLASCWQELQPVGASGTAFFVGDSQSGGRTGDSSYIFAWKESFLSAYQLTDQQLARTRLDVINSGTTAVILVKQGNDLVIGNAGDSRAVMGTRTSDNSLLALQLTVDSKPDVPREAERIRRYKGRVFPLPDEPSVHRVWLPNQRTPGLAMSRALGDFSVKSHGVIAEPEVTYRRLSKQDEFVVLATDGVWDVLTNEEVIHTVASTPDRSCAAKAVVARAVTAWKAKNAATKIDDCAAVCLFIR